MKFKEGRRYRIIKLDEDIRKVDRKYEAMFSHMTDNLVVFDKGPYKVCEIKTNYRRTWKARGL